MGDKCPSKNSVELEVLGLMDLSKIFLGQKIFSTQVAGCLWWLPRCPFNEGHAGRAVAGTTVSPFRIASAAEGNCA